MIVRILSAGTSFKGLGAYLTHDANADTNERVAWTHTLNCANDHVPSAIDEMLWTARDAELLKQEAGIRAGGRATENTVKHLSLNWHPDEKPSREHMIETTEEFLRSMRWGDHQAVLVAHSDRAHSHVHVMLNTVHSETGLKLDDNFEQRRAQAWALEYERQHENILCENRLKPAHERAPSLTRPAWEAFQDAHKEFEQNEKNLAAENWELISPENLKNKYAREWDFLKNNLQEQRQAFFAGGKQALSELRQSIYQETREELRPRWAEYYAAEKEGFSEDALKEMKAALVAEQKSLLGERRDAACADLLTERKETYRELLDWQAGLRHELHDRQKAGLWSENYLAGIDFGLPSTFRETAREVTQGRGGGEKDNWGAAAAEVTDGADREDAGARSSGSTGVGRSLGFGLASIGDSLFRAFLGETPAPRAPPDPVAEQARLDADRDKDAAERKELEEQWSRARGRD